MRTLRAPGRSAENKLEQLRQLDAAHAWSSPNDRFYCLRCSRVNVAREIQISAGDTPPLRCPSRGCDATPEAWAMLSPRDTVGAARPKVRQLALPILTHNGTVAVVQRPLARGRAPRNLAARLNRRRTIGARVVHAVAQSLHRLVIDYRSLLASLQPGTRRSMFDPLV